MEALLYDKLEDRKVRCALCSHRCIIPEGRRGVCGVRENRGGVLNTLVYGRLIARHIDPIEKKPLYHFLPGSLSYSIATVGCNFRCRFCQNADIAQMPADSGGTIIGEQSSAAEIVAAAEAGRVPEHLLHLHRAHGLFRVRPGNRKTRPRQGHPQRFRHQRLHDPGSPGDDQPLAGRRQRGPQGVHLNVLPGAVRREARARAGNPPKYEVPWGCSWR